MPLVDEVHVCKGAHINLNVHFPQINLSLSSSTKTHAEFFVIVTYVNVNMVVERQQPISKSSKTYRVLGSFTKLVILVLTISVNGSSTSMVNKLASKSHNLHTD